MSATPLSWRDCDENRSVDRPLGQPLALSACDTTIGKLVILASLRNPTTGTYKAVGLDDVRPEDADRTLRNTHERLFAVWIGLSLAEQAEDLSQYFASLQAKPGSVPRLWRNSHIYHSFMPRSAPESHKSLFVLDITALLELFDAGGEVEAP